jgi:hypothetical protein
MMAFANATFALLTKGGSSCPQDDGRWTAGGANTRRQRRSYFSQRVEDNAFHLCAELKVDRLLLKTMPKLIAKGARNLFGHSGSAG